MKRTVVLVAGLTVAAAAAGAGLMLYRGGVVREIADIDARLVPDVALT
jgi:hypothetical protein